MNKVTALTHEFVDFIPDRLQEAKLYISLEYATVAHKCCCGCGKEVVTPLSPTDWKLSFDGQTVTLDPSVGNWSFPCQSHYWVRNNSVQWAPRWSKERIEKGRVHDRLAKEQYFKGPAPAASISRERPRETSREKPGVWKRFMDWYTSRLR